MFCFCWFFGGEVGFFVVVIVASFWYFYLTFCLYFDLQFFFPLFVLREREKACVFVWERQQRQRKRKSWSWERGWEDLWGVEGGETMWTNYIVLKILVWKGIVFIVNSTSETRVLWVNKWTMTITLHNVWKLTKNFAGQNINL